MDETATATWSSFEHDAPDLAASVRAGFVATKHHVLATLRRDGAPRVSGTEVQFHGDELLAGMMPDSAKGGDLRRDGRFALHANPGDGSMAGGDAKIAGRAVEVTDPEQRRLYAADVQPPPEFDLFALRLGQVVHTALHPDGDRLVITSWRPGSGVNRVERR